MRIFAFEPTREITRFDSHAATVGGVARASGEVRVSLRLASPVPQIPDFVLTFESAPPNLQGPR